MINKLGVRSLVEFTLKSGDLNPTLNSQNTPQQGARIHRQIQRKKNHDFKTEYYLEQSVVLNHLNYLIHGRADVINLHQSIPLIEEIKTSDLAFHQLPSSMLKLYWGQVKTYAHLLFRQKPKIKKIKIKLTYVQTPDKIINHSNQIITEQEANHFFNSMLREYEKWLKIRSQIIKKRNQSASKLRFPFKKFRPGQRELAAAVYKSIVFHKHLFVEAPTGTGKTISTLFPSIKAMGKNKINRLFYLTAKQSTRHVAEDAINLMDKNHLYIKSITLTAKSKIQFKSERNILPEKNPYMLGYYDRLKPAMKDVLGHENQVTKDVILKYAKQYRLDPFEFSLDLSLFCDVIICDYNYVFDPQVYLKRFFTSNNNDNFFLVDEAHNLVNRSREMYSAQLSLKPLQDLIRITQRNIHRNGKIINKLKKLRNHFEDTADKLFYRYPEAQSLHTKEPLINFDKTIMRLNTAIHKWLPNQRNDSVLEAVTNYYFQCISYLKISDFYDHTYRTRVIRTKDNLIFRLFCIDPSSHIADALKLGGGAVLFSATLSPMNYYQRVLGNEPDSLVYRLDSPFPSQNQLTLVTSYISTIYRKRQSSLSLITDIINRMVQAKSGHYIMFFPSNYYLKLAWQNFHHNYPQIKTIIQKPLMDTDERNNFIKAFKSHPEKTIVGFALMGGIFAEGIDFKANTLIGVGIISVGLPKINPESDLVMKYFNHENHNGFEYAYQLPGLNHVLQAAGRLIRSNHDHGIIALIDSRFTQIRYTNAYPNNWLPIHIINTPQKFSKQIKHFWQKH